MKSRPQKRMYFISIMIVFVLALAVPIAAASDTNDQPGVRFHFSFLIKAGKTQEALQAFRELSAYFKAKFKSGPVQIYILKSNERDYLHCFIDYKDKTSYKKTASAYRVDAEWHWNSDIRIKKIEFFQKKPLIFYFRLYFSFATRRHLSAHERHVNPRSHANTGGDIQKRLRRLQPYNRRSFNWLI